MRCTDRPRRHQGGETERTLLQSQAGTLDLRDSEYDDGPEIVCAIDGDLSVIFELFRSAPTHAGRSETRKVGRHEEFRGPAYRLPFANSCRKQHHSPVSGEAAYLRRPPTLREKRKIPIQKSQSKNPGRSGAGLQPPAVIPTNRNLHF